MSASFNQAEINKCDFTNATAEEVKAKNAAFIDCNFTQADFIESDFNGTRFDNCDFSCISMEKSCIKGTEFFGTEPEPEQQLRCYILGPDPEQNQNINL